MMNESDSDFWPLHWVIDLEKDAEAKFGYFVCSCSSKMAEVFNENISFLTSAAVAAFILFLIYYYLFLPMDLRRDLCDVGFDYLTDGYYKSVRHKTKNKRELVREVQRLRKIGDLPPIYPNGWFALLESDDLKKSEVKHVVALGENFAVFRNDRGEVKILDAYCPHLGANMAVGGVVRGNCLECPFHNWRFDGETGECSSVPYSEKTPDFIKVKKWECVEVNSFVFVWYHAEGEEPSWYPKDVDAIKNHKWPFHGRSEFLVGCHIQEIPENGADVAHLNAIHSPSLFGGHDLRFYEKLYLKFMRHIWGAQWNQSPDEGHVGIMNLTFDTRVFSKFSIARMDVRVEQIGPGYVELMMDTSWGPMLLLQTVTPIEGLVQRVTHRMYAPYKQMVFAKFTLYAELIMFERDVMVWNHKKYLSKPVLVKEDKTISRHRRWYNQFYSEHSPRFSFQKDTLAW